MNQRGQSLVLSLVFLTVLVGMAALVVDVGSWYRADRKLQANADAAALAAAQELPANRAEAEATALAYAATNDGGLDAKNVKFRTTVVPHDTVEVTTDRPSPGFFAQLFGRSSVDVRATAAARTGVLSRQLERPRLPSTGSTRCSTATRRRRAGADTSTAGSFRAC